jgi:SAM-dependent methyltransferase
VLQRTVEPELMNDPEQVAAYAGADFSASHDPLVQQISVCFPETEFAGTVLNLGCGSGDDSFRFLYRFPASMMIAVDGAPTMIARAEADLRSHHASLEGRVQFLVACVPGEQIPQGPYVGVISNSMLHHMHNPLDFWSAVVRHAYSGSAIFVADLRRPFSIGAVETLVDTYAAEAPDVLRADFRNSLCAAFTTEEVCGQLHAVGLSELTVAEFGDRHLFVHGTRR